MARVFPKAFGLTLVAVAAAFIGATLQVGGPSGWFVAMGLLNVLLVCFWTAVVVFPVALLWFGFRGRNRS